MRRPLLETARFAPLYALGWARSLLYRLPAWRSWINAEQEAARLRQERDSLRSQLQVNMQHKERRNTTPCSALFVRHQNGSEEFLSVLRSVALSVGSTYGVGNETPRMLHRVVEVREGRPTHRGTVDVMVILEEST